MAKIMTADLQLETGMRFAAKAGSGHYVLLDASETDGGRNAGFHPMELILLGLAGCIGMQVISKLREQHQEVTGYEVRVQGMRSEDEPQVFEDITVEHIITGHHLRRETIKRALALSQSPYCAAEVMLGKVVSINHMLCLVQVEEPEAAAITTA
jgi:putative redox protein